MTVFGSVLSILLLLLATTRSTLGFSPALGEDDPTSAPTRCTEVLRSTYDNDEELAIFLPARVRCEATKVRESPLL